MTNNAHSPLNQLPITFIGAGNMARSIAGGLLSQGIKPAQITLCDPSAETRALAEAELPGINTASDNINAAQNCDLLILAVKPQVMQTVCTSLSSIDFTNTLILSIAAGVTITQLSSWLQPRSELAIVRCMPNTPALINEGMTGYFANAAVTPTQKSQVAAILAAIGQSIEVASEAEINAVTALSGSGPAYFFFLLETMTKAGEQLGLSTTTAQQLAIQTAVGASKLAQSSEHDPETLRKQVTSPGGTTEAALNHLFSHQVDQQVVEAIKAAQRRAVELSSE